jgi:hypothetical protein
MPRIARAKDLRPALEPAVNRLAVYMSPSDLAACFGCLSTFPGQGPAKVGHLSRFLGILQDARPKTKTSAKDIRSQPDERLVYNLQDQFSLPTNPAVLVKSSTLARIAAELLTMPFKTR